MDRATLENGNVLVYLLRHFHENRSHESASAVLRCLRNSFVLVPCSLRIDDDDADMIINSKIGDIVHVNNEIGMRPDILINNETQERLFPVFSQYEQIPDDYGVHFSYLNMHFVDVCDWFKQYDDVSGIIVDPFTVSFTLTENIIEFVQELPSEIDEFASHS